MAIANVTANNTFQDWLTSTQQLIVAVNSYLQGGNVNVNFMVANTVNLTGSGTSLNVSNSVWIGGNVYVNQNVVISSSLSFGGINAYPWINATFTKANAAFNVVVNQADSGFSWNINNTVPINSNASSNLLRLISGIGMQIDSDYQNNAVRFTTGAYDKANTANALAYQADLNSRAVFAVANGISSNLANTFAFTNVYVQNTDTGLNFSNAASIVRANATSNVVKFVSGSGITLGTDTANLAIRISTSGRVALNVFTPNVTYANLDFGNNVIFINKSAANSGSPTVVYLPFGNATPFAWYYDIKDARGDAQINNIQIQSLSANTIDGQTNYVISTSYRSIRVVFDGANWIVL